MSAAYDIMSVKYYSLSSDVEYAFAGNRRFSSEQRCGSDQSKAAIVETGCDSETEGAAADRKEN